MKNATGYLAYLTNLAWPPLFKTHGSESREIYTHHNNNYASTTREYFTGTNVVQIQPSETLPLLMLSLWNSIPKLIISQETITETMKQIRADHSQIDIADIKRTLLFLFFFFCSLFCLHAVSGKYHELHSKHWLLPIACRATQQPQDFQNRIRHTLLPYTPFLRGSINLEADLRI